MKITRENTISLLIFWLLSLFSLLSHFLAAIILLTHSYETTEQLETKGELTMEDIEF